MGLRERNTSTARAPYSMVKPPAPSFIDSRRPQMPAAASQMARRATYVSWWDATFQRWQLDEVRQRRRATLWRHVRMWHFLTQWTRWNRVVAVDVFCRWWQVTLRARGVRGPCALLSKFGGPWPRGLVPFITCCLPKGVCVGCGGVGYSSCAHCWIFWCHVCWAAMQACKSVEWDQVHALESTTICSGCHKKMRYQQRLMEHEEEMCAKKDILKRQLRKQRESVVDEEKERQKDILKRQLREQRESVVDDEKERQKDILKRQLRKQRASRASDVPPCPCWRWSSMGWHCLESRCDRSTRAWSWAADRGG